MKRELRERRDRVKDRHDALLDRFPSLEGSGFEEGIQSIIEELTVITQGVDEVNADPVELARTYRWLGDAYYDLSRGAEELALSSGAQSYARALELLARSEAPVEKAKLEFNYGNTLRGLSKGFDIGLLETAKTRYENAIRAFRQHNLPDLAAIVDEQLRTIGPQLSLARKQREIQEGLNRLGGFKERLERGEKPDHVQFQKEMEETRRTMERGQPGELLQEAFQALSDQVSSKPERFLDPESELDALKSKIDLLSGMFDPPTKSDATSGGDDLERQIMQMLSDRIDQEASTGKVSADRAASLQELLKAFGNSLPAGDEDLDTLASRNQQMREILQRAGEYALKPSWQAADPPDSSRAHRAISVLEPLKKYLIAEQARAMLPADESQVRTDLLKRLVELEARIREVADDDERVAEAEPGAWRLALEIQAYARRYHVMVAHPEFAMRKEEVGSKSVFLSGGNLLKTVANALAGRIDLNVLDGHRGGDLAQDRWNQLCSASVAVFDLGLPEGAARAQVAYELGLALALGKPAVVVKRPGQALPFDVNLVPVGIQNEGDEAVDLLDGAIRQALSTIVWGGGEAGLGKGPDGAIAWLDRHYHQRISEGTIRIAHQIVERNREDAVAFRRSMNNLLGMLGGDAPALLLPAWPPVYPDPSQKPRCFHVMPFRPDWANDARDRAAAVCQQHGWFYLRGDNTQEQRIIRAIWQEIAQASAVLVDITDHNPNVALELGLAHALGRHYRVVARGRAEDHFFPSLQKVQIHVYDGAVSSRYEDVVGELLSSAPE